MPLFPLFAYENTFFALSILWCTNCLSQQADQSLVEVRKGKITDKIYSFELLLKYIISILEKEMGRKWG